MNEETLKEVKLQLHAAYPVPLTAARIHRDAKKAGYTFTLRDVTAALTFLKDDGVAQAKDETGTIEQRFTLTAKGVRHCIELFS
ncbi:MAG: hypothetical protein ACK4UN_19565 [Limisphaerales bacterium]